MYDRTARDGTNLGAWAPEGRTPTNNAPLRGGKGSVFEGGIRVPTMVYWPGVAEPNTVSDEIICSIDYYPTILDMLGIRPQADQVFDGISIVPALSGRKLRRRAVFGHFPHYTIAVPCRPASWVREGDWKLIRFYETDEGFPDRLVLYNLKDDIGELKNLAGEQPKRIRDMERMLDEHLAETGALVPRKNPNYRPDAAREVAGWNASRDGWLEQGDKTLILNSIGPDPFIQQNVVPAASGKLVARFRMRSDSAGGGQFFWITENSRRFGPHQRLDFAPIHGGAWHEYEVPFEANGALRAIRIDPSTAPGTLEFEWIRIDDPGAEGKTLGEWRFAKG
jgi:hypothetical protein